MKTLQIGAWLDGCARFTELNTKLGVCSPKTRLPDTVRVRAGDMTQHKGQREEDDEPAAGEREFCHSLPLTCEKRFSTFFFFNV